MKVENNFNILNGNINLSKDIAISQNFSSMTFSQHLVFVLLHHKVIMKFYIGE